MIESAEMIRFLISLCALGFSLLPRLKKGQKNLVCSGECNSPFGTTSRMKLNRVRMSFRAKRGICYWQPYTRHNREDFSSLRASK